MQAVLVEGGVLTSNGTLEKRIQVVITSGMRDKIGQEMLPTRSLAILYIIHSFAVFLFIITFIHYNL